MGAEQLGQRFARRPKVSGVKFSGLGLRFRVLDLGFRGLGFLGLGFS